jgi:hypothetical protein
MNDDDIFFGKLILKRVDNISDKNHDFEDFKKLLFHAKEKKINIDIPIRDASKNFMSNLLAVKELIGCANNYIRIYTSDLRNNIYGDVQILYSFYCWLLDNPERKIDILVKEDIDIKQKEFNGLYERFKSQIRIKKIHFNDTRKCYKNAILVDKDIFKIKKIEGNEVENVIINFSDTETTTKLVEIFDKNFINSGVELVDKINEITQPTKESIGEIIVDTFNDKNRNSANPDNYTENVA